MAQIKDKGRVNLFEWATPEFVALSKKLKDQGYFFRDELDQQWQESIRPLDYLDHHALTNDGLTESAKRLADQGAPDWAIDLRGLCVYNGWHPNNETWVPQFALRSEVALSGLQIHISPRSPKSRDTYRRVWVRFMRLALQPFIDDLKLSNGRPIDGFMPLFHLHRLCESPNRMVSEVNWTLEGMRERIQFFEDEKEVSDALSLASTCMRECREILFRYSPSWWHVPTMAKLGYLLDLFSRQHQWRVEGQVDWSGKHYVDLMASAYLAALEAECPPPDWMPKL